LTLILMPKIPHSLFNCRLAFDEFDGNQTYFNPIRSLDN